MTPRQHTMIRMGLRTRAIPTARLAPGAPICSALWANELVWGIRNQLHYIHTRRRKSVPAKCISTSNRVESPSE